MIGPSCPPTESRWLEPILQSPHLGVLGIGCGGNCSVVNAEAARIVGVPLDDLQGGASPWQGESWSMVWDLLQAHVEARDEPFVRTAMFVAGGYYTVRGHRAPCGVLVTLEDVTASVETELAQARLLRELEFANEEMDEFSWITAHDLKSPVVSVIGLIGMLAEKNVIKPEGQQLLAKLQRAAEILGRTSDGLSEVLQLKKGLVSPVGCARVTKVVQDVLSSLSAEREAAGAEVEVELNGITALPVKSGHLYSALRNLVSNAIKFRSEAPPEIRIELRERGGGWSLSVRDNGIGIDVERYGRKVFQLFSRLDHHRKGSGVGLYAVEQIALAYRGKLDVVSRPGEGATFRVGIPVG